MTNPITQSNQVEDNFFKEILNPSKLNQIPMFT